MSDPVEFDPHFVRTCTFATLHTPGYGTRVTLFNGVLAGAEFATPMTVTLSAFDREGHRIGESDPIAHLDPGEIAKVEVDDILRSMAGPNVELRDVMGILHLIPDRFVGQERCEVSREELMAHTFATDDFIEYFSYDGDVVTGVAYQTGPINDLRFATTRTTTIQAPKVIVGERVDTIFLLMNLSTSFDYADEVTLRFHVMGPTGVQIASSSITVTPFTFHLLSIREVLRDAGAFDDFVAGGGCGTLIGLATDGSLVPLSMTRNDNSGAIAVDHTLPPIYYVNKWGGDLRKRGNARLQEALFAQVPEAATV
jgi:hypothetical protein